ncbi:hypothetical protein BH11BAC1_BH11BAC1_29950 [soil metagenome]
MTANQGAVSYQWYQGGILIPGATNYFYVAQESGDFNVVCTDNNGCEVEAVIIDVVAGIHSPANGQSALAIYPNPVSDKLTIQGLLRTDAISIYNMPGARINMAVDSRLNTIDCGLLAPGMYLIEVISGDRVLRSNFIKK